MSSEFLVQEVLELACAAQRVNGEYVKQDLYFDFDFDEDNNTQHKKFTNRTLITYALGVESQLWAEAAPEHRPPLIKILQEDKDLADTIKHYFRRLIFSAIADENSFESNVNQFLNSETITVNNFGFIACLPSVYQRYVTSSKVKKAARSCDASYLGSVGGHIEDKDCEIIEVVKSKNFEAYNITAIIDNMMVSWMSKFEPKIGPAVVVRAKIKELSTHYRNSNPVTRLNYVKVVQ